MMEKKKINKTCICNNNYNANSLFNNTTIYISQTNALIKFDTFDMYMYLSEESENSVIICRAAETQ